MHHILLQSFCRPRKDCALYINLADQLRFGAWKWSEVITKWNYLDYKWLFLAQCISHWYQICKILLSKQVWISAQNIAAVSCSCRRTLAENGCRKGCLKNCFISVLCISHSLTLPSSFKFFVISAYQSICPLCQFLRYWRLQFSTPNWNIIKTV